MCEVPGCDRPVYAKGWCRPHYDRQYRGSGDLTTPVRNYDFTRDPTCSVEGCDRPHCARGWCETHYSRWKRRGRVDIDRSAAQSGPNNPRWLGDDAGYFTIHQRLRTLTRGPCADCGDVAVDWSYQGGCPDERIEGTLAYCTHPEHYLPRCRDCHHAHDRSDGSVASGS